MDPISHEELGVLLGIVGTIIAAIISFWWSVEHRQDKKIDQLHEENHSAHLLLHKKIDAMQRDVHQNHTHVLAKFEELWRNIKNGHQ